jgi:hydroxymethylbilane synthase
MIKKIILGSRGSTLARIQSNFIISMLLKVFPEIKFEIKIIKTKGDIDQSTSLKFTEHLGLFADEIQKKLINGEIDVAVHSLKDLPINHLKTLKIGAIPVRENPMDLFYHPKGFRLDQLQPGANIGTCSLRRTGQLRNLRNDLIIKDIRGNIENRINKVNKSEFDGIILASAGLIRLGIDISKYYQFKINEIIPAPGQGALAVEIRQKDIMIEKIISIIDNLVIRKSIEIERGILDSLGGGCSLPIGVYSSFENNQLNTIACIVDPMTGIKKQVEVNKWKGSKNKLISIISNELLSNGGNEIISNFN